MADTSVMVRTFMDTYTYHNSRLGEVNNCLILVHYKIESDTRDPCVQKVTAWENYLDLFFHRKIMANSGEHSH